MPRKCIHRAAGAFVVALAATAVPAHAGVGILSELIARTYCADTDGTPHPKRITVIQAVNDAPLDLGSLGYLLAGYGVEVAPGRARIKGLSAHATLIKADGSEVDLGLLRSKVSNEGDAQAVQPLAHRLGKGDLIEWQLQFKGLHPMVGGACFLTVVGQAAVPLDGLEAVNGVARLDG